MKIFDKNINIDEAITYADYDNILLKRRSNNMLLSDYQIYVLANNGIDFNKFSNGHDLLTYINMILENNYQEELDFVASEISEMIYYSETKK